MAADQNARKPDREADGDADIAIESAEVEKHGDMLKVLHGEVEIKLQIKRIVIPSGAA